MSEAKPFEPTAARLERARREGDVLRSADLTAVAAFGCAAATVPLLAGPLAGTLRVALFDAARADLAGSAYATMAALVACVPLAAGAGALVAALVAAGGLHLRFPAARFERLDPRAGLRRILSRETLLSALKAVLATLALALVLLPVARSALAADAASAPGRLAAQTLAALERSLAVAAVAGSGFACLDVLLERAKRRRRLRMSFDEFKRDQKQNEGDPALRGRRRQAHRALAHGSLRCLPEAAFVVTNPTHVAVALAYRPPEIAVPRVLVRATGETAQLVKRRARALGIAVIEDAKLARSLFAATSAGDYIPREAYVAVAAIVAALLRSGALRA